MRVTPIRSPLPGEHLAATWPRMRPDSNDSRAGSNPGWRLRLHFWAGRALTRDALDLDQENRAAHLAWRGRAVTAGIVRGLETALEAPAPPPAPLVPAGHFIHLLPGHGITLFGEDVIIPRPLRIALDEIPIQGVEDGTIPWAAVLVLRPAEFRHFDNLDPNDPCEIDLSRDAFADERRQDAALLRLVPLPAALEADVGDRTDPRWRNRLAHLLFAHEAAQSACQELQFYNTRPVGERWDAPLRTPNPEVWHQAGLPLALLSSEVDPDTAEERFFLDRGSVARPGGQARARTRPAVQLATNTVNPLGAGTAALWRAQVDQFAEHLGTLVERVAISDQARRFQFLPPAGLLPREALDILTTEQALTLNAPDRAAVSRFFPASLAVEAVPIPIEDLDAALAASAPLAPFDLDAEAPELVRLLVPLPLKVFDPHLLVVEREDPLFATEVGRLVGERQDWRQRRDGVRQRQDALQALVSGPLPDTVTPPLERGQLEPEPVETLAGLGFDEALLSPTTTRGPWEMHVAFGTSQAIDEDAVLSLRIRTDADASPGPIVVEWRRDDASAESFRYQWDEPPPYPLEQVGPDEAPLATPLWRIFSVRAGDIDLTDGEISGFTLRLGHGRIALSEASIYTGDGALITSWRAQDTDGDTTVQFTGGEWTRITGDALLAPFERRFEPVFSDGLTLDARLDELPTLRISPFRNEAVTVRGVGLQQYITELKRDIAHADDRVDLGFLKAQSNTHRIRQVLLGEEVANDLLISPALNSIIKKKSARASQDELVAAFQAARQAPPLADPGAADGGADDGSGGGSGILARPIATPFFLAPGALPPPPDPINIIRGSGSAFPGTGELFGIEAQRTLLNFPLEITGPGALAQPDREDVVGAEPSIGQGFDLRTLTIAKRFEGGTVLNAFDYADVGLREIIALIPELNVGLEDSTEIVPDITRASNGEDVTFGQLARRTLTLNDLAFAETISPEERSAAGTLQADTGRILARGIRKMDAKVLILRRIEFYIEQWRRHLRRATEVLTALHPGLGEAAARLVTLHGRLAEARHDVSVARALRLEEQQRVAALNERRDTLIRQDVKFLAFARPRAVDPARRSVQSWRLEPAGTPAPIPACLQQHDEPPDPLRAYVQLFRHAPVRWFTDVGPRLTVLNTREKIHELMLSAQQTATRFVSQSYVPFVRQDLSAGPMAALQAGFSIIQAQRSSTAGLTAAATERTAWSHQLRRARQHASLGDVIDGRHGNTGLARRAADELDKIEQVATCLHAEFAALPPAVRLAWVERYSQFDRPSPLNQLYVLPHFENLPRVTRRRLQEFADWLFGRVNPKDRDAFNLVNDLVRICLLLASHAPVRTIISGHVPRPVPVLPGALIPLRPIETLRVRVGMEFQIWRGATVVAQGRVEDLDGEEVTARVNHVEATTTSIDPSMQVQFIPAAFAIKTR